MSSSPLLDSVQEMFDEKTPPPKRGRGRPKKAPRVPNQKYQNTRNNKILTWNKILREHNLLTGGKNRVPKKGTPEYENIKRLYDEAIKSQETQLNEI